MGKIQFDLNSIVSQTPSCLKVINSKGELLNMNEKGLNLIEAEDLESVLMADVYSLVEESHRDKFMSFNEKICSGESGRLVFEIVGLGGTRRWMETFASPLTLDSGEIAHIAVTNDITQSYQEKILQESISELRKNYILHSEDKRTFFDYVLNKVLSLTQSEYGFIGEVLEDDSGKFLKTYSITDISWDEETRKFYKESAPVGLEFRNLDTLFGEVIKTEELMMTNDAGNHPKAAGIPKGHPPLNSFLGVPILYSGNLVGMVGVANREEGYTEEFYQRIGPYFEAVGELTYLYQLKMKKEEYESELKSANQYLELALEGANLGVWDWWITDNSVRFDRRWAEMLGLDVKEIDMCLDTWKDRVHPEDLDRCFKDIQNYMDGKTESYINVHRMRHVNGSWVYILDQGKFSDWDESGKPIRFTGTHLDITVQKEQELEITDARNKALVAERAKSAFLANMSHEIRTPMNGVLGIVDLLQDTNLDEEQVEMVSIVKKSGDSLMSLLNDILDLSKIESGKMLLEEAPFNLQETLESVSSVLSFIAKDKGTSISLNLTPESNRIFSGDSNRIKQIVLNFLSNGIKFSEGGKVELKATLVEELGDRSKFKLTVIDNGIGISGEEQKNLFQDFVQAEAGTTRKFGGTGLGLSICKRLADLMNAEIELTSAAGKGTSISLLIDLVHSEESLPVAEASASKKVAPVKKHHFLIAEDNEINQKVLMKMLERLGFSCDICVNGREAVNLVSKNPTRYSAVFMDMQMPEMDGIEATEEIIKEHGADAPPIVAVTANAFESDRQRCFESGMKFYLSKPIKKADLSNIFDKLSLRNQKAFL